jgi:N-acetylmuramoyl-L-alanine amidase
VTRFHIPTAIKFHWLLIILVFNSNLTVFSQIRTVVIDAGHGGRDPGCGYYGIKEKDITLSVALNLSEKIKNNHPEVKIILTREKDVFLELWERTEIANKANADLFISLHCNAVESRRNEIQGSETYVMGVARNAENLEVAKRENAVVDLESQGSNRYGDLDPNSPEGHIFYNLYQASYLKRSIMMAKKIEKYLPETTGQTSHGVKQSGFFVIRNTAMPSVLVEMGYLSHPTENKVLSSEEGQEKIASALASAFTFFKKSVDSEESIPEKNSPKEKIKSQVIVENNPTQKESTTAPPKKKVEKIEVIGVKNKPQKNDSSKIEKPVRSEEPLESLPAPENKKPPVKEEISISPKEEISAFYTIQLKASPSKINLNLDPTLGTPIVWNEAGLYKYTLGKLSNFQEAKKLRNLVATKGFPDAFIIGYINGQRVGVDKIKQSLGE